MKPLKSSKILSELACRYVWWEKPEWAYAHPHVLISNIMNLGSWDDIQILRKNVGDKMLQAVLADAPAGYFSHRSWDYWHVKFNMLPIPPLPSRKF